MYNVVLSPITPGDLIDKIAAKTAEVLAGKFSTNSENDPEDLLTPEEAAKFLKVTSTSLWRMRKAGKIKLYGLGGKRYYKKSELLNALEVLQ